MTESFKKKLKRPLHGIVKYIGRTNPELLVRMRYYARFHKPLDIDNPQNLNEKILYLSLRTDTTKWSELADKYQVREYVKSKGLEDILVPLLGVWDNADTINFAELKGKYILKSTNGSGDFIIVNDSSAINEKAIRKSLRTMLNTNYGELEGGKHYMRIPHRFIAERLLENDEESAQHSSSLIDYKIWCFNGKADCIWTCLNRDKNGTDVMTYDTDWNAHPEYSVFNPHYRRGNAIPRPQNLEHMLEIAEQLSAGFPVVRVDLYNIAGKIYFSEMTFTSLGGMMDFYTEDFLLDCGKKISLNV